MGALSLAGTVVASHPLPPTHPPTQTQVFPWLRIIISLREPISRALSMRAHMADKHNEGCLAQGWVGWRRAFGTEQGVQGYACSLLLCGLRVVATRIHLPRFTLPTCREDNVFECVQSELNVSGSYAEPLEAWISAFSTRQVCIRQCTLPLAPQQRSSGMAVPLVDSWLLPSRLAPPHPTHPFLPSRL